MFTKTSIYGAHIYRAHILALSANFISLFCKKIATNQHAYVAELLVIINFHTTCLTAVLHYVGQLHYLCAITVQ